MPDSDNQLEIGQLLDILAQVGPSSAFYSHAASVLDRRLVVEKPKVPEATAAGARKLLTIGMATRDDYDGVYFSVQAIRLYHPEITDRTEILVIDNHPEGPCAGALKDLEKWVKNYRYVPAGDVRGTAVRDMVFREAAGDFVLCMDAHVLFPAGALKLLLDYLEANPDSKDLLQGPLLRDDIAGVSTHFDPVWRAGMWGIWADDPRGADPAAPPFEIPMQGLGVFACRRDVWPGFNPRLRGFGGEEGYLHQKFRQAGARTLCLPFLRWLHRFNRPLGTPYEVSWEDRIRNYLVAFDELGLDPAPVIEHFEQHLGAEPAQRLAEEVRREIANPFHFFDAIYCINLDRETGRWEAVTKRFQRLGIAGRVCRFSAIETPWNHHIGCALSHRAILAQAKRRGLRNVLVFEDDVMFPTDALEELRWNLDELRNRKWWILYLGGHRWGRQFEKAPGCRYLEVPYVLTASPAIAYNHTIYGRILTDIPDTPSAAALWLRKVHGIDQYCARALDGFGLLTSPIIATQPHLRPHETRSFADP